MKKKTKQREEVRRIDRGSRWAKEWDCENRAKGNEVTTRAHSKSDQYSFSKQAEGGAAKRRADSSGVCGEWSRE